MIGRQKARILGLAFATLSACDAADAPVGDAPAGNAAAVVPPAQVAALAYVRLPAVPGRPAAGYLRIAAAPAPRTLLRVTSPAAGRIELHRSMAESGGAMTMHALPSLALPADSAVTLAPGGLHLMLFDIAAAPGQRIPLTLHFAQGPVVTVNARAIAAGDPPPTS